MIVCTVRRGGGNGSESDDEHVGGGMALLFGCPQELSTSHPSRRPLQIENDQERSSKELRPRNRASLAGIFSASWSIRTCHLQHGHRHAPREYFPIGLARLLETAGRPGEMVAVIPKILSPDAA